MRPYTFREMELKIFAKPNCKKCYGTGRTGYIKGIAQICKCVKGSLSRVKQLGEEARKEFEK